MALPSTAVIEVRTTGSDSNGGGFNSARGGVDYSQQNSAQATGTATAVSTTLTATTGIFTSQMVGNYVTDGTTWVEITAYTSPTIVTIDRDPSWTAVSIKVGGALASPYVAIQTVGVSGNIFWIKKGTYSVGVSIPFDHTTQYTGGAFLYIYGYDSTRGDTPTGANRPTLKATAGITILAGDNYCTVYVKNVIFDGDSGVGVSGFTYYLWAYSYAYITNCEFKGFSDVGSLLGVGDYVKCSSHNNNHGFSNNSNVGPVFIDCVAYDNTLDGFGRTSGYGFYLNCIAYGNGQYGFNAYGNSTPLKIFNCTAYNNAYGFVASGGSIIQKLYNCLSYGNSVYGIYGPGEACFCAFGNNTSGNTDGQITLIEGNVTLSANPFTNAAGGDFSLNNTAGGGAACRAAGFPGLFPGGLTTGYLDIGAAQHQDVGGSTTIMVTNQSTFVGGGTRFMPNG